MPKTWILTGSPENHAVTRERGFTLIGVKERRRNQALEMEPGDRIVLYATRVMAFAGSMRIVKDSLEHIAKWPPEHWKLAFQGQLRTVSEHDARLLLDGMGARVPA